MKYCPLQLLIMKKLHYWFNFLSFSQVETYQKTSRWSWSFGLFRSAPVKKLSFWCIFWCFSQSPQTNRPAYQCELWSFIQSPPSVASFLGAQHLPWNIVFSFAACNYALPFVWRVNFVVSGRVKSSSDIIVNFCFSSGALLKKLLSEQSLVRLSIALYD